MIDTTTREARLQIIKACERLATLRTMAAAETQPSVQVTSAIEALLTEAHEALKEAWRLADDTLAPRA